MAKFYGSPFTVLFLSLVLGAGAAATGCGGDDDDDGTQGDGGGGGGGVDAGGGPGGGGNNGGGSGTCDEPPCLAAPGEGQGFQIRLEGAGFMPREDNEWCQILQLPGGPGDTYYVNGFASEMTIGSHHLIVAAIVPGSRTDQNAEVDERRECFGPGGFTNPIGGFGGGDLSPVTGQQVPTHEESFPAGVGRVYTGGQKLIFNYHYFNATDDPIVARAAVNFYTTDADQVTKVAEEYTAINFDIDVPQGETASFDHTCTMDDDAMVYKLTRHTHRWGTDFLVYYAGGEHDGELIYTSPSYENPDYVFPEPVLVRAGEGFRFVANYDNTDGDHDLHFGETTMDEMDILFATIFSPDSLNVPSQGCFFGNPLF